MQIEAYLKNYQPVIYQTFLNQMRNKRLSHAFLIEGSTGTPIFETACYLAKSLICDNPSPLACENCITCMRVDDMNYPDFVIYNGEENTIKKDAVSNIENMFSKAAFEEKGIKIYILHLVENMTTEAINAILKFLEEPASNIYAFLTTHNKDSILPTITSRCQIFRLKSINRNKVINAAISYGVSEEDAQFLSYFYNEPNLIVELVRDEDKYAYYQTAKEGLLDLLNKVTLDKKEAIYFTQRNLVVALKSKESMRYFLDMLTMIFTDVISLKNNEEIILTSEKELITKLNDSIDDPTSILLEILKNRSLLSLNVNTSLLLQHLILTITGGKY